MPNHTPIGAKGSNVKDVIMFCVSSSPNKEYGNHLDKFTKVKRTANVAANRIGAKFRGNM